MPLDTPTGPWHDPFEGEVSPPLAVNKGHAELFVLRIEPITLADLPVSGASPPPSQKVSTPSLQRLRDSHHGVARLLASGVRPLEIANITGYSPSRISTLQADPTFIELVEHYRVETEAQYVNVHGRLAQIGTDALQELQSRLDEAPETFSIGALQELAKAALDRAGYAPVKRNENLNLNANMTATDLARIKSQARPIGSVRRFDEITLDAHQGQASGGLANGQSPVGLPSSAPPHERGEGPGNSLREPGGAGTSPEAG